MKWKLVLEGCGRTLTRNYSVSLPASPNTLSKITDWQGMKLTISYKKESPVLVSG